MERNLPDLGKQSAGSSNGWNFSVKKISTCQAYPNRVTIHHPAGGELETGEIHHPGGDELAALQKSYPAGTELVQGFSPQLSWTHYRILMAVENEDARDFYERERRLIEAALEERKQIDNGKED